MSALTDTRPMQDQEDRANLAVNAMVCLQSLIAGQCPNARIETEPLSYLIELVVVAARDAIPNGWPKHGRAVNDQDIE